eukprot:1265070-Rhodomonas_salina.1
MQAWPATAEHAPKYANGEKKDVHPTYITRGRRIHNRNAARLGLQQVQKLCVRKGVRRDRRRAVQSVPRALPRQQRRLGAANAGGHHGRAGARQRRRRARAAAAQALCLGPRRDRQGHHDQHHAADLPEALLERVPHQRAAQQRVRGDMQVAAPEDAPAARARPVHNIPQPAVVREQDRARRAQRHAQVARGAAERERAEHGRPVPALRGARRAAAGPLLGLRVRQLLCARLAAA